MNRIILKNSVKEIKKSFRRFLSLMLISMLGVGFFAGVKATTPDMQKTIDTYFDNDNLFDIKVVSTLGLTDEDIVAIKNIEGITDVYGSYSEDVYINIGGSDYVVKVMELTDTVNKVKIIDGRLPQSQNECVVEDLMLTNGLKIGDTITIKEELDEDEDSSFNEVNVKIVGSVHSPLYISEDKGSSTLGDGKLSNYIYVLKNNINSDIYTEIYAKVKNAKEMNTTSKKYADYIDSVISNVETIKEERQTARYDSLINEANEKLADAQKEFDEKKLEGETEIADAEKKISDGEKELTDGEKKLADAKEKANTEITDATNKLTQSTIEFESAQATFNFNKEQAEAGFKEAENKKKELQASLQQVTVGLDEVNRQYDMIVSGISNPMLPEAEKMKLQATKPVLEAKQQELNSTINQINAGISQIDAQVANGKQQIADGEKQIINAHAQISNGWNELNSKKAEAETEFANAEKEIADAKVKRTDGRKELDDAKKEFDEKITDAENKLLDARQEINDIEKTKWYILDRSSNNGYDSYINDTKNIEKLGHTFPIIFFIIAVLISLTSMSRMVEEQRIELGTMKALGYSNSSICIKYAIYAFVATVIGGIIGMMIGFNLIPRVIISMYQMMYPTVTEGIVEFNLKYAVLGLGIMTLCTVGATLYSTIRELTSMPAMLMRPKPPKSGKRVFLEYIPFIWNRLGFTEKVTVRNMFRYKKRFLMTVLGITGCTALILAGFALKDSMLNLMNLQYGNVCKYEIMLTLKSSLTEEEVETLITDLEQNDKINNCEKAYIVANEAQSGFRKTDLDVQIIVTKNPNELVKFIGLKDAKTLEPKTLNNEEIFITEKMAELLKVKQGDIIDLYDSDGNKFNARIGAVVENYVYHYVYMTSDLYKKIYGEDYKSNTLYVQTVELDENEENILHSEILSNSKVSSIFSTNYMKSQLSETMQSLNKVVYVLIVSAGLLAFVVLYNLANVNISERIRELATIKVLGFYDKEVYDYITKEIVVLTVIGIILGLFAGYWLGVFILKTCETEPLIFKIVCTNTSYFLSAMITIVFTIIVNFMTYFVLKKVDMIESLKSVE